MSSNKDVVGIPGLKKTGHSLVRRANRRWVRWSINFETRKQLLKLDQHELDDIGLTHQNALIEGKKPFWQD